MKEKKEKPLIFRMRAYAKGSQKTSFNQTCEVLISLQHYLRTHCITERKSNDLILADYRDNFKQDYIRTRKLDKEFKFSVKNLPDADKLAYWKGYNELYKKVVYKNTDLNYLYVGFREEYENKCSITGHDIKHIHSDIYQAYCQQFAGSWINYENNHTKIPRKIKNLISIPFKGTSFELFKEDMPKKYHEEYDIKMNKLKNTKRRLIYLHGIGLVEFIYHNKEFNLEKVTTVKLVMSQTGNFYIDFCYDLIKEKEAIIQLKTITEIKYKLDLNKEVSAYDFGAGKLNWLTGSNGLNFSFEQDCNSYSKEVIKAQRQLDGYKNEYKELLKSLFNQTYQLPLFNLELIKNIYPKKEKESDKYDELEPVEQKVKIISLESLEKELSTIQKYKELDKLFGQLISFIPMDKRKALYKEHDRIAGKIRKKERTLSMVWEKIGFKRKDLVCKTAIELLSGIEKYLVFEDLDLKNLMSNLSSEENRYKFKSLRRSLGNVIYRDLIERTMLKAYKIGKIVLCINPRYTSMDCSKCGVRNFSLKLSDRVFKCTDRKCSYIADRDYNASENIKAKGIVQILYGEYEMSNYNDTKLYNKSYKNSLSKMTDGQISQNGLGYVS